MLTKNIYEMPYPSAVPTDMDGVKNYIDTLSTWLANCLGLVVRDDLAIEAPSYAPYSYVTFLAPDATSDPYLCIHNQNLSDSRRFSTYHIHSAIKVDNYFRPFKISDGNVVGNSTFPTRNYNGIHLNISNLAATYKFNLVVVDFNDGRKIASIRSTRISDGAVYAKDNISCIYIGNILMRGNEEKTCVLFASGANSAWMEDYEQCANSSEITDIYSYAKAGALIYSTSVGKEFFLEQNYCIGSNAYVPNIIQYSDSADDLAPGSIITVNNKKYACLYYKSSVTAKLLMPEEVE